jgi:hypothetical protein
MARVLSQFRKTAIVVTALCGLLGVACSSGMVRTLADLNAIRQHLISKYHDEVAVNLQNSQFLNIVFVNSPVNKMGPQARTERAEEAARFVSRNYEGIKSIEQIWISFVATETYVVFFHKTQGLGSFGFDKDGSPLSPDSGTESDLRAPVVRFSETRNETDISLTRIQLEGNMNKGVALVPHFTVTGDARQNKLPAPEFVVLEFAFYSPQSVFTKNAQLDISCDERPTVKGFAQLMPASASGSDETIAQFLSVRISFKSFLRMSAARTVKINLDSHQFELKPGDVDALARLAAHVDVPQSTGEGR